MGLVSQMSAQWVSGVQQTGRGAIEDSFMVEGWGSVAAQERFTAQPLPTHRPLDAQSDAAAHHGAVLAPRACAECSKYDRSPAEPANDV